MHGAATLAAAYLRVSDRAGVVVLGGALRWLGPAHGDRQFYRIAELLLQARYDSWVTPDLDRIPRTALPPGTLVVVFSPLLDPRGLAALTDLRRRGFPLIVVDTLRDEPPASRTSGRRQPGAAAVAAGPGRDPFGPARPRRPGAALDPMTPNSTASSPRSAASRRRPPPGGPLMTRPRVRVVTRPLAGVPRLAAASRLLSRPSRRPRACSPWPGRWPGRRPGPTRWPAWAPSRPWPQPAALAARPRPRRGRRRCHLRRLYRGGRRPGRRGPVHPGLSARRRRAPGSARPSGCAARRSCSWPG